MRLFSLFVSFLIAAWAVATADASTPLTSAETADYARQLALPTVTAVTLARIGVHRDLHYAQRDGRPLRLDLYLPAGGMQPRPCVIVIAGGGFLSQDRTKFGFVAAYLAARGFAAASIDYRGAPDNTFPATVHDAKAAVRWVRTQANTFSIDSARIGAIGQSAGAHIAAMLAVSAGVEELEGDEARTGVSSRIQGAVALAGVFDFISRLKDGGHQQRALEEKRRTNGLWIGEPFSATSERWRRASPINHVTGDDAPVLFVHCRGDTTAPFAQSVQMFEVLRLQSPRSKLVLYDGGRHNVLSVAGTNALIWEEAIAFLTAAFAPR